MTEQELLMKEIELLKKEIELLKMEKGTKEYIPYPVYPQPYNPSPWWNEPYIYQGRWTGTSAGTTATSGYMEVVE